GPGLRRKPEDEPLEFESLHFARRVVVLRGEIDLEQPARDLAGADAADFAELLGRLALFEGEKTSLLDGRFDIHTAARLFPLFDQLRGRAKTSQGRSDLGQYP